VEDKTKMLSELLQFRSDALTDKLAKLRQRCLNVLDEIATTPAVESPEDQFSQVEEIIAEPEETNSIATNLAETTDENPDNLFDLGF
jgi:hypothetical protein